MWSKHDLFKDNLGTVKATTVNSIQCGIGGIDIINGAKAHTVQHFAFAINCRNTDIADTLQARDNTSAFDCWLNAPTCTQIRVSTGGSSITSLERDAEIKSMAETVS